MHESISKIHKGILTYYASRHRLFRMSTMKHVRTVVLGLSQTEFAEVTGVNQATVSRWDQDKAFPDLKAMRKIREFAKSRDIPWDDSVFFDAPGVQQERNNGSA